MGHRAGGGRTLIAVQAAMSVVSLYERLGEKTFQRLCAPCSLRFSAMPTVTPSDIPTAAVMPPAGMARIGSARAAEAATGAPPALAATAGCSPGPCGSTPVRTSVSSDPAGSGRR